ncbi:hypothetical protein EON71_00490 [bacterium]|nr:MAG: hypothetical protein EON71_00490 [bacterium]
MNEFKYLYKYKVYVDNAPSVPTKTPVIEKIQHDDNSNNRLDTIGEAKTKILDSIEELCLSDCTNINYEDRTSTYKYAKIGQRIGNSIHYKIFINIV